MATNIVVPQLGESVVEATVGQWLKKEGDTLSLGEIVVELETDKVDVEVGAETSGVLVKIVKPSGEDVKVGEVLGVIEGAATSDTPAADTPTVSPPKPAQTAVSPSATPVARRMAEAEGVDVSQLVGSGPGGRITKQDVQTHLSEQPTPSQPPPVMPPAKPESPAPPPVMNLSLFPFAQPERETRKKMSRRRRTIAQRLVEAQQTAAMLTTFNEVDMGAVMDMRKRRQESFNKAHGIKLGFSSFFVKAVVGALKTFPQLNAEIQGDDIVLKHYYDIGMAVGAEEGLVVPVIRDADRKSFAEIEKAVRDYAQKARDGSLTLEDLRGGTFTITNGGVFGSMLSTPILNPPQVGILGLHNIVERPIARQGEVVIRPIMYVALTYDHRMVDGREAVQFLVKVKELIEDPEVLLLEG